MAAARLVTSKACARVWVAMALVRPARRLSWSGRWMTRRVLPAPGGEATTTAGSPDQAANSAAPRVGSVWCGAVWLGSGSAVPDSAEVESGVEEWTALSGFWGTETVRRAWPLAVDAIRPRRQPRRAARPVGVEPEGSHPRARSGAQRSDDAAPVGRCAAGAGRLNTAAA